MLLIVCLGGVQLTCGWSCGLRRRSWSIDRAIAHFWCADHRMLSPPTIPPLCSTGVLMFQCVWQVEGIESERVLDRELGSGRRPSLCFLCLLCLLPFFSGLALPLRPAGRQAGRQLCWHHCLLATVSWPILLLLGSSTCSTPAGCSRRGTAARCASPTRALSPATTSRGCSRSARTHDMEVRALSGRLLGAVAQRGCA